MADSLPATRALERTRSARIVEKFFRGCGTEEVCGGAREQEFVPRGRELFMCALHIFLLATPMPTELQQMYLTTRLRVKRKRMRDSIVTAIAGCSRGGAGVGARCVLQRWVWCRQ